MIVEVVAVQDNDSHWYVIPKESLEKFRRMSEEIDEDWEDIDRQTEFDVAFGDYRTGGDLNLVQLYADL